MQTQDPNLTKTPIGESNSDNLDRNIDGNKKANSEATVNEATTNKGTDTLTNDVVDSEHVKQGDNPARQPDRRDQQGSTPFDGNVNNDTISDKGAIDAKKDITERPQSDEITDHNRYATLDNAQTRVLDEDSK